MPSQIEVWAFSDAVLRHRRDGGAPELLDDELPDEEDGLDAVQAREALAWVEATLGDEAASAARVVSAFIGHPEAPNLTVDEAMDELGPGLVEAMTWLAAGVVATAGNGHVEWIRQFDVGSDQA